MAREIGENKMADSQRTIKFRAWDGKRMITESLVKEYDAYNLLTLEGERISHLRLADEHWNYESANKNPLIWLQFTGLKDKHGKEIFEGDILRYGQENGEPLPYVNFESGLFGRRYKDWDPQLPSLDLRDMDFTAVEIIGNVFEHPHLLAGGDENDTH